MNLERVSDTHKADALAKPSIDHDARTDTTDCRRQRARQSAYHGGD